MWLRSMKCFNRRFTLPIVVSFTWCLALIYNLTKRCSKRFLRNVVENFNQHAIFARCSVCAEKKRKRERVSGTFVERLQKERWLRKCQRGKDEMNIIARRVTFRQEL